MKPIKPRPPQTRVKHIILEKYLRAWGSIIIHGLKSQSRNLHFVYIDCNASYGRYAGELKRELDKTGNTASFWFSNNWSKDIR